MFYLVSFFKNGELVDQREFTSLRQAKSLLVFVAERNNLEIANDYESAISQNVIRHMGDIPQFEINIIGCEY
jgi:hypothetical protein